MKIDNRKYYEAYEERYKAAHKKGISWEHMNNTPIVLDVIDQFKISFDQLMLEIGCGEGRDSKTVLENGYRLMAIDISPEAIKYCKETIPEFKSCFSVLDVLSDNLNIKFDYIYSIAVIHMLVLDEDRDRFYQFIYNHLNNNGVALICTMGDGAFEMQSDINKAFDIEEREHETGKIMVAGTTCRMVSFSTFDNELGRNGLVTIEKGITSAMPNFNSLMYAVVKKNISD